MQHPVRLVAQTEALVSKEEEASWSMPLSWSQLRRLGGSLGVLCFDKWSSQISSLTFQCFKSQ